MYLSLYNSGNTKIFVVVPLQSQNMYFYLLTFYRFQTKIYMQIPGFSAHFCQWPYFPIQFICSSKCQQRTYNFGYRHLCIRSSISNVTSDEYDVHVDCRA